jgi:hypothetical protein
MFFQKDKFDNTFIFILIFFFRLNFLQEITSLTAVLSNKASSISNIELSGLVPELGSSNIGLMVILIELGKHLFETASNKVVNSYIVRSE